MPRIIAFVNPTTDQKNCYKTASLICHFLR